MRAGDRVGVAVSGGADSVGLLRLLLELRTELGVVLSVIHINHSLRGREADEDESFVAKIAQQFGLEAHLCYADVRSQAREHALSLEAAGRKLRYELFAKTAAEHRLGCIATGHTLDDQAETVLLKFLRGTWTRGLAGIYPKRQIGDHFDGAPDLPIVRPLLNQRRSELRQYLESIGQPWREDATNADHSFTRNRIRHELLPLIEGHYSSAVAALLSGMAEIARDEQEYWDARTAILFGQCGGKMLAQSEDECTCWLDSCKFSKLALAEQRRLVSFILGSFVPDLHHIEVARLAILHGKTASLPGGMDLTVSPGGELQVRRRARP